MDWLFKDKFLKRFYILLLMIFCLVYYIGQERNRRLEEQGFVLCYVKGRDVWVQECNEDKSFLKEMFGY